jgi:hypothetical protein
VKVKSYEDGDGNIRSLVALDSVFNELQWLTKFEDLEVWKIPGVKDGNYVWLNFPSKKFGDNQLIRSSRSVNVQCRRTWWKTWPDGLDFV